MAVAVAAFLALGLLDLETYPPVGEDEPWIAAAPAEEPSVASFTGSYVGPSPLRAASPAGLKARPTDHGSA